jgi:pimeloyl-ACP methyl ester carboxylesterase
MPDNVDLMIDVYRHPDGDDDGRPRPVLVCFHASQGSRAEYRPIVGRLLELGVHVVAADLRHGGVGEKWDRVKKERYGTPNGTWLSAQKVTGRILPKRIECYADMDFAVRWARQLFPDSPIGIVGSSFSATLALGYAAEHPREVAAVMALSPSDRYIPEWDVAARVKKLLVPAYVTCSQLDKELRATQRLLAAMPERVETVLPRSSEMAAHGSRTLSEADPELRKRQWKLVENMVERLFRTRKKAR